MRTNPSPGSMTEGGRPGSRRSPGGTVPVDPGVALRAAMRRVVKETRWVDMALSDEDGRGYASLLLSYLEGDESAPGEEVGGADRVLMCRLIQLTRAELLEGGYRLRDGDLVALMRRLEDARGRFEPDWHHALTANLTGANALDLVVELVHDLRSPLTSIMFLSETLRKGQSGEISEIQRKQLGIIYSAAFGLVSVASDVIDLAREEETRADISVRAPFSLAELMDSVRVMVGPMAEEKKLDLTFLTPEHDVRVGQAVPLARVLLNLTTNAIKFTEKGTIELVARDRPNQQVEFSVRDTGRGMDDENLRAMYQPFRRSRSSTGFHFSGTGLGLAICRRMVELMGATLKVESKVDQGTRFSFTLELPRASRI